MVRSVAEAKQAEPYNASTSTQQNNGNHSSDTSVSQLHQVDIARQDYLRALEANEEAKRQYAEVVAQASQISRHDENCTSTRGDRAERLSLLNARRRLLRLQERHSSLVCLKDDLDAFSLSRGVSNLDIAGRTKEKPQELEDFAAQLQGVTDSVQQLVTELEFAVIRARHQAKWQRQALDSFNQTHDSSNAAPSEQERLAALQQTRSQLTAWLEENLDKCQQENDQDQGCSIEDPDELEPMAREEAIDQEYENYLEARKQVVSLAQALGSEPLPVTKSLEVDQSETLATERKGRLNAQTDLLAVLNRIEKGVLPLGQQENRAHAHKALLDEQQSTLDVRLAQTLDRVSDESQLLQAFPMLAHSGRLKHAAAVFGKKESEHQDHVTSRLQPWIFAAEAADIASTGTLDLHVTQGNEAMGSVSRSLTELRLLREADR